MAGAAVARGEVLLFQDGHTEVSPVFLSVEPWLSILLNSNESGGL